MKPTDVCTICGRARGSAAVVSDCPQGLDNMHNWQPAADEIDHEYTTELVCPHCGEEQGDSWELGGGHEGDLGEQECGDCGKSFYAYRNIEVTYCTSIPTDEDRAREERERERRRQWYAELKTKRIPTPEGSKRG